MQMLLLPPRKSEKSKQLRHRPYKIQRQKVHNTRQWPNAPPPSAISYDWSRVSLINFCLYSKLVVPWLMIDSKSKESNCKNSSLNLVHVNRREIIYNIYNMEMKVYISLSGRYGRLVSLTGFLFFFFLHGRLVGNVF